MEDRMNWPRLFYVLVTLSAVAVSNEVAIAQTNSEAKSASPSYTVLDCDDVSIQYTNDPTLTREEKLIRMDQALGRALSKYEACQTSQASKNSSNSASSASAAANLGAATNSGGSDASSEMTGAEPPLARDSASNSDGTTQPGRAAAGRMERKTMSGGGMPRTQSATVTSGKTPEDIPPADNDSVLESQIRQAAINEKDPEIKKKLWNEYRKYKGLPHVN
jgi:hypothetical protein